MPRSATIQPQGRVRINSGNPLARGLSVVVTGDMTNRVTGKAATPDSGAAYVTGPGGRALSFDGSATGLKFDNFAIGSSYSVFAIVRSNTASGTHNICSVGSAFAYSFQLRQDGSTLNFYQWNSIDQNVNEPGAIVAGATNSIAFSYDGPASTLKLYRNGAIKATNASMSPIGRSTTDSLRIGEDNFGAKQAWDGSILALYFFDRALSAAEIAALTANPWQVLEAPAPMLYAASAPTTVSGNISWTEAADTASIAATAKVTAAASWTESADSAAISASATVSGSIGWTEAADSVALAGSAGSSIAGNVSWTEAADTASIAASARITGAAGWTEQADSINVGGSVSIGQTGSISWTEAADSIAIAGSVTAQPVVGTIAWTEQADVGAPPSYPRFYSFTLMRADPISSAGAMSSAAQAFTLMRSDPIASRSAMSDAPLNQNVNLI